MNISRVVASRIQGHANNKCFTVWTHCLPVHLKFTSLSITNISTLITSEIIKYQQTSSLWFQIIPCCDHNLWSTYKIIYMTRVTATILWICMLSVRDLLWMAIFSWSTNFHGKSNPQITKLDMCLWNTDAPSVNKVEIWQKSPSPIFWPHPQGHVMSVKCEEPIDELSQSLNTVS